jgi:hypothetical protein
MNAKKVVPPWIGDPHGLITMAELIEFNAQHFWDWAKAIEKSLHAFASNPELGPTKFSPVDKTDLLKSMASTKEMCEQYNLRSSVDQVDRISSALSSGDCTFDSMFRLSEALRDRISDDLKACSFKMIPSDRVKYYRQDALFGDEVSKQFPSALSDTREAGNCFAVGCFTASVYHLMRVLEHGLIAQARIFHVDTSYENWNKIIEQIETKVRDLATDPNRPPDWKAVQEFHSQAAQSFILFKNAWRNYVAHTRGSFYTPERAEEIFVGVKSFMIKLAEGGLKEIGP